MIYLLILISILFIIYIIFHPPFRRIIIKTPSKYSERYIWMGKKPFTKYPFFRSWTENGHFSAFVSGINDHVLEENDYKIEVEIK
jgi:hypothetical protein